MEANTKRLCIFFYKGCGPALDPPPPPHCPPHSLWWPKLLLFFLRRPYLTCRCSISSFSSVACSFHRKSSLSIRIIRRRQVCPIVQEGLFSQNKWLHEFSSPYTLYTSINSYMQLVYICLVPLSCPIRAGGNL